MRLVRLSKNGGDIAQKNEAASLTHDELGVYGCPIDATDLPDRRTGIVLEVEDLRKFHQDQIDYMTFIGEPVEAIHGLMVSFKDPGGNILDLYQPTPEKVQDLVKETVEKEQKCESSCCSQKEAS